MRIRSVNRKSASLDAPVGFGFRESGPRSVLSCPVPADQVTVTAVPDAETISILLMTS